MYLYRGLLGRIDRCAISELASKYDGELSSVTDEVGDDGEGLNRGGRGLQSQDLCERVVEWLSESGRAK
jgi:hypothetical protein